MMSTSPTLQSAVLAPRLHRHAAAIEVFVLAGYILWLAAVIVRFAGVRPLWYDEFFTLSLARVQSPRELLGHLAAGVDLNPPLLYWLTRASILTFGESLWAIRLPAVLGMMLGMVCWYVFVRRSRGPFVALLAVAASVASVKVWVFFLEARPYGLVFGLTALAFLSWQRARENRRWWIALGLACVLGVSTHYYFVLMIAVLGLAELARIVETRKLHWPTLFMLFLGGLTILAWYPLWSVAPKEYAPGFWAKVTLSRDVVQEAFWQFAAPSLMLPLVVIVAAAVLLGERGPDRFEATASTAPKSETIALVLLAAGPLLAVILGAYVTGGVHYRYVLPAAFAFGTLFAIGIHRTARGHPAAALLGVLALLAFGLPWSHKPFREFFRHDVIVLKHQNEYLETHAAGRRVVMETSYLFGRLRHGNTGTYEPAFLADPARAMHYNKVDTSERAVQALKRVAPIPAFTVDELVADLQAGQVVFFYGPGNEWCYKDLIARGVRFELLGEQYENKLYRLRKD